MASNPTSTATAISSGASSGTSRTLSITVPTGNQNQLLVVFVSNRNGGLNPSVTYNGTSMTKGAAFGTVISFETDYFYLANPTTGTHNIVVSWTGSSTTLFLAGIVLKDAFQGAPETDAYKGQNTATSISQSVTTSTNNDLILAWFPVETGSSAWTEGGSQTREVSSSTMSDDNCYAEISSLPLATAGAQAMSLSWTTGKPADALVTAIKYVAPTSSVTPHRALLGVGI